MDNFRIGLATQEHIDNMKRRMRKVDNDECKAANGTTAAQSLQQGYEVSIISWAGLHNEKPFCCFGVATYEEGKGVPWMLGTNDMKKEEVRKFVKGVSKTCIARMLEPFEILENWVDARNLISVNWLEWCGFTIEEPKPFGIEGKPFHRFWMEKGGA